MLAIVFCVIAVISIVSAARSDKDDMEVVQASEILEKIGQGEPVDYVHNNIVGNISIDDLRLHEDPIDRRADDIISLGLSKNMTVALSPLILQDCLIDGNINFSNARFLAPVSFRGSHISGDANFHGSHFCNSSDFGNCQFLRSADFIGSQFSDTANFIESRFKKNVKFIGSQFSESADFRGSQFGESAYFKSCSFNKSAYFSSCEFSQSADFNQTQFLGDLSLEGTKIIGTLGLSRAEFGKIFLRWKCIGHLAYDETAYFSLMGNFKNLNFIDDANQCYYDYRNDRRATLPLLYLPVDYGLMLFYGYGVKPDRPVIWSLVFMALFAVLFWWRQGILPVREGEPEDEANRFSLLEAAAFSAMTFLSGGKLVFDPPEYKIAPGRPWRDVQISKAFFILERLLGMVLIIMFAIAVGKTIVMGG